MTESTNKETIVPHYSESRINAPVLWESHCHTQFEMIAVVEGDITVLLEGQSYRLQKNQIILIPPLSYHTVTANEKGSYRRITALFDLSAIPDVLQNVFAKRDVGIAIIRSHLAEQMCEACQKQDRTFYAPLTQSLMIQFLYEILRENQTSPQLTTDEFLQKALSYIDRHLHEKILLDDLARHTARSKSSFCHLFEKKMNISPKQYILQKKLALAQKMINEGTPHTIAAMQVGYENYSNFYRLYQKNLSSKKD